ncbi:MAG: PAS domain S-box protein [Patescibacteria group bacterium]
MLSLFKRNGAPENKTTTAAVNHAQSAATGLLAECADRYRLVFNTAQSGIAIVDADTARIEDINVSFEKMSGCQRKDAVGRSLWDKQCCLRTLFADKAEFADFIREGVLHQAARSLKTHKGELIPVEVDANVYDECGRKMIRFVPRDITERQRIEENLRSSEERFRRIFEEATVGIVLSGLDFKFIRVNRKFCEIVGRSESELLKLTYADITHPDHIAANRQGIGDLLKGTLREYNTVKRYLTKSGQEIWASTHVNLIRDASGQPLYFLTMIQDITAQRTAELVLIKEAERESFLLDVYGRAAKMSDQELYEFVLDRVVRLTDSAVGFFHLVIDGQKEIILNTWNKEALKSCRAPDVGHRPIESAGNWMDAMRQKKPVIYNDFAASPNRKGFPSGHVELKRLMSVPTFENESFRILFGVGNKQKPYNERDIAQVQLVAATLFKIIRQRQVEKDLRESEMAYRQVFEGSQEAFILLDGMTIVDCNDATLKMFGTTERTQIIGRRPDEISPLQQPSGQDSQTAAREAVDRALKLKFFRFEWMHRRMGGQDFLAEVTLSSFEVHGRFRCHAFLRDLSEREQQAKMFMQAFNTAPLMMTLATVDGGEFIEVNEAFTRITGYSRDEVLGQTEVKLGIVSAEDRQRVVETLRISGRAHGMDTVIWQKGGSRRICRLTTEPVTVGERRLLLTIAEDVTDQQESEAEVKRVHEQIRRSEADLRQAQKFAKIGSWRWHVQADKLEWSDEMYRIFGIDKAKFTGRLTDVMTAAIHPDDRMRVEVANRSVIEKAQPMPMEYRIVHPDGAVFTVWAEAFEFIRDAAGKISVLSGIVQDITDRRRVEHKFTEARQRFVELFNSLPVCIYRNTPGPKGSFIEVNPAMVAMFEADSKEELLKISVSDLYVDPADRLLISEKIKKLGFVKSEVVRLKTLKGRKIWGAVTAVLKKNEIDKEYFDGVIEDVTARVEAESALRASEEKYRNFIENTQDIIYAADPSGVLTYISPQVSMYGYKESDLIGRSFTEFVSAEFFFEEDLERARVNWSEFMKTGVFKPFSLRFRRRDGQFVWVEASGSHYKNSDNKLAGTIGVVRNIHERKVAEEHAYELDTIKNKFVQVVSQQMRTPLSSVRWGLEQVLSDKMGPLTGSQRQILRMSLEANKEAVGRIADLLLVMDIEAGRLRLEPEKIILEDLVRSVCANNKQKFELKKITHEHTYSDDQISTVNVDQEKFRDLFGRLLDNAISYTPEGGRITTRIKKEQKTVRVEVTDTGIGIPTGEQEQLFRRFHRFSNAAIIKPEGSGIGLHIAKSVIEAHGGKMGYESQEGKGSTFWFELPLAG